MALTTNVKSPSKAGWNDSFREKNPSTPQRIDAPSALPYSLRMAKKSAEVAPVALRPALPRSVRQATAKNSPRPSDGRGIKGEGRPSSLLDTRVIYCGNWHTSYYVIGQFNALNT